MADSTIIVIPARMASTRLPGKPLADLHGEPMIVQVWRRGLEADIGPVLVAAAEAEIVEAIAAAGGEAVLTDPDLPSGSDRIAAALKAHDPNRRYQRVVNLQGDLPTMDPEAIRRCAEALEGSEAGISTLAAEINDEEELRNPNVVKALAPLHDAAEAMASDFLRELPAGAPPPHWHHIGIYGYRRDVLERFVALPPSRRERERRLEQMRALDNGIGIVVARVSEVPFGVDTPDDLDRARRRLAERARR